MAKHQEDVSPVEGLRRQRDEARGLVLRLYAAITKPHWQEGETLAEVFEDAGYTLFDWSNEATEAAGQSPKEKT